MVFNVDIVDFSRVAQSEGKGNVLLTVYIILGGFSWKKEHTPHSFDINVIKLVTWFKIDAADVYELRFNG